MTKFYHFNIQGNRITKTNGEIVGILPEFHHYEHKSFGVEEIYYKAKDGKVVEVICKAFSHASAEKAVNGFLLTL